MGCIFVCISSDPSVVMEVLLSLYPVKTIPKHLRETVPIVIEQVAGLNLLRSLPVVNAAIFSEHYRI